MIADCSCSGTAPHAAVSPRARKQTMAFRRLRYYNTVVTKPLSHTQKLARSREQNAAALARLEAKIAADAERAKAKATRKAASPPPLKDRAPDVVWRLDIQRLRQAGLLASADWRTIEQPASLPMLDRLLLARYRVQAFFAGRAVPLSIEVVWSRSANFERAYGVCPKCGRRCLKLYFSGSSCGCRLCMYDSAADAVGRKHHARGASQKRNPSAPRPPATARQRFGRNRDSATGRFVSSNQRAVAILVPRPEHSSPAQLKNIGQFGPSQPGPNLSEHIIVHRPFGPVD